MSSRKQITVHRHPWTANHSTKVQHIYIKPDFNAQKDAEVIFQTLASGDPKVQYEKLIELLGKPNIAQRQELVEYSQQKGKNLKEELLKVLPQSEIATNKLFVALLDTPAEHDAKYLEKAMRGLGTNEDMLIEILVTRSNDQLRQIKSVYHELFNRDLKDDIESETSGTLKQLVLDLLEGNRDESFRTDPARAKKDADTLYKAGEGKWGTDEDAFVKVLANQNMHQLQLMFNEYEKLKKHPFEEALKAEFSGDELKAFLEIANFVRNGPLIEEVELLHKCIQQGAKDEMLVHLIASFTMYDTLGFVLDEYKRRYKIPLEQAIEKSGKPSVLKNALIYIIKGYK